MNVKTASWVALITTVVALASPDVSARSIRVDIGNTFNTFTGGLWDPLSYPDLSLGPAEVSLAGFVFDFGQGTPLSLFIHQEGFVSFGSASSTDIIAPYQDSGLTWAAVVPPSLFFEPNSVSYSRGIVDTAADPDPNVDPYSQADALPALRVTWNEVSDGADIISAQLVLIQRSASAFDIELNYGSNTGTPTFSGYALGAFTASNPPPYTFEADRTLAFSNGEPSDVTTPPTPVPEPSTWTLLLLGLAFVVWRHSDGMSWRHFSRLGVR
jgi:hypothetical protein